MKMRPWLQSTTVELFKSEMILWQLHFWWPYLCRCDTHNMNNDNIMQRLKDQNTTNNWDTEQRRRNRTSQLTVITDSFTCTYREQHNLDTKVQPAVRMIWYEIKCAFRYDLFCSSKKQFRLKIKTSAFTIVHNTEQDHKPVWKRLQYVHFRTKEIFVSPLCFQLIVMAIRSKLYHILRERKRQIYGEENL